VNPLDILGTLVAVFVAMDPVGALPLVVVWTGGLSQGVRERQLDERRPANSGIVMPPSGQTSGVLQPCRASMRSSER
jgi:small neutral amino acid transporter SnatA (MarC family)